ncbi:MAG: hypothetical protein GXP45_06255 [bacterium]|nr:hypothetical protein [bacterium]
MDKYNDYEIYGKKALNLTELQSMENIDLFLVPKFYMIEANDTVQL